MDGFIKQLEELIKSSTPDINNKTVSDHCKHVAIKHIRSIKNGTRGPLELRYLLEDLLDSLPDTYNEHHIPSIHGDPYKGVRAFARLFTGENGVAVPLKAKPKRPASIDASTLVTDTKRSKGDVGSISDPAILETELANIQLLYDLFNDIKTYTSHLSSSSKLSISGLLSQALSTKSSHGTSLSNGTSTNGTSESSTNTSVMDIASLQKAIDSLLPPAPRGQALRDKADQLFGKAETFIKPSIAITSNNSSGDSIYDLLDFLDGLIEILAHLCAPIRDTQVYTVQNAIATGREYASIGTTDKMRLDKAIRYAETPAKKLVLDMQHDLQLFKLGITVATTDEEELRSTIRREAMEREKELITKMYGPHGRTKVWMQNLDLLPAIAPSGQIQRTDLARCLVEALFKPQPMIVQIQPAVTTPAGSNGISTTYTNFVPPVFHLAAKHLFVTQNRLQAFTILATLNTIVPPSIGRITNASNGSEITSTWSERVWTLLNSEMSDDDDGNTTTGEENESHVRLANLADEIVKVLREARNGDSTTEKIVDEEKIRSSVDRMLRLEDRVFALLHGRLKNALVERLVSNDASAISELQVKGFSVSPLPAEIKITLKQLVGILDWACESWGIDK